MAVISDYKIKLEQLDIKVSRLLKGYPVSGGGVIIVKEYVIEKPLDIEDLSQRLKRLINRSGLELLRHEKKYEKGRTCNIFEIGTRDKALYILKIIGDIKPIRKAAAIPRRPSIKIAIVIDDWGYNVNNIELLDSIGAPLTISILPNLPFSAQIAGAQHGNKNREIILHMPMEPEDEDIRLEENTLLTSMGRDEILNLLRISLKTVPYAKGLSNHMGSKATQDERLVRTVMESLKQGGLYFMDSMATPNTICQQEAKRLKLKFAKRDVFLDNVADKRYISLQMDKLIKVARRKGSAVGIGHDRTLTLQVIKEKTEQLNDNDVEFVVVSEITKI